MKVVIMAGGKGTRISSVASDIPKPMIKIEDVPVLEREIECLKNQGFDDIIIITLVMVLEALRQQVNRLAYILSTILKKNHSAMRVLCSKLRIS